MSKDKLEKLLECVLDLLNKEGANQAVCIFQIAGQNKLNTAEQRCFERYCLDHFKKEKSKKERAEANVRELLDPAKPGTYLALLRAKFKH